MATKKSNTLKTKSQPFKFRWWMAVLLVVIVAGIGIAVLRFSHAGQVGKITANYYGVLSVQIQGGGSYTLIPLSSGNYQVKPYPGRTYPVCSLYPLGTKTNVNTSPGASVGLNCSQSLY